MVDHQKLSVDVLRTYVQDAHLSLLIGAGSSAGYFVVLGGVEDALAGIEQSASSSAQKEFARASVLAHFFTTTLEPNRKLLAGDVDAKDTIDGYRAFGRALNRILLNRKSTLLDKRACIFTTNVDLMCEVGFDLEQIPFNDGFSGRFTRILDTGSFGNLQLRTSTRYERQSEIPAIDLIKLHGSVDWIDGGNERVQSDPTLGLLATIRDRLAPLTAALTSFKPNEVTADLALESGTEAGDDIRALLAAFDRLAVVLPEKAKFASTLLAQTYYELLRRFANELERENSLLLVHGFSFRDEHLRDLALRAARTNPTLQVIVFCYTEGAAEAIRTLLPEVHVPNKNVRLVAGDQLGLAQLTSEWLDPLVGNSGADSSGA